MVQPSSIEELLEWNKKWAARMQIEHSHIFKPGPQTPPFLWIGCIDSRVPETTIFDMLPREFLTHRNMANVLPANDLSSLSVLQFAVETIEVKHIIICGHTNCGGVNAALGPVSPNPTAVDYWVQNVRKVLTDNKAEIESLPDLSDKKYRLVELNIAAQVQNCCQNSYVKKAIDSKKLEVHGFLYDVSSGYCKVV